MRQRKSHPPFGFDKSLFLVDWEAKVVTCPAGKKSISWLANTYPANGTAFEARFARLDCTPCSSCSQCTRSKQEPRIWVCRLGNIMRPCKLCRSGSYLSVLTGVLNDSTWAAYHSGW